MCVFSVCLSHDSPFSIFMAALILLPSLFLIMALITWPKLPSPMTSSNLMSSQSRMG